MNIEAIGEIIKTIQKSYPLKDKFFIKNVNGEPKLVFDMPSEEMLIGTVYQIDSLSPDSIDVQNQHPEYFNYNKPIIILCRGTGVYDFAIPPSYYVDTPYTGRPFIHTQWDCFTLLRDYYKKELSIEMPPVEYFDDWWKKGEDFYMKLSGTAGFYPVTSLQKHDIIAMRLNAYVFNHSAIYLGDNKILHHVGGKFSCIEEIRPAYVKNFFGFFRHKELITNG